MRMIFKKICWQDGMPTTTTKQVRGKTYLYFTYYDTVEKKKKEIYCGVKGKAKANKKAILLEKEYLEKQKNLLMVKANLVQSRLNKISLTK